jgi:hypothetical protein
MLAEIHFGEHVGIKSSIFSENNVARDDLLR